MAFDETMAGIFRDALSAVDGITERKMFGGLCFMLNGNMLCGVSQTTGMARVGKMNEAAALELDGITPLSFTGRPMGGMVDMSVHAVKSEAVRIAILDLAFSFVGELPAK